MQIGSAADLDKLRSVPRAVVFIYVNWAIQARRSEMACHEHMAKLEGDYPGLHGPIYRVDLSEQEGEVWVAMRKWLKGEGKPHDPLTYGGYGATLWVRSGEVAAYVAYPAEIDRSKLMAITRGVFDLGSQTNAPGLQQDGPSSSKGVGVARDATEQK
jgi:hypothetical protein